MFGKFLLVKGLGIAPFDSCITVMLCLSTLPWLLHLTQLKAALLAMPSHILLRLSMRLRQKHRDVEIDRQGCVHILNSFHDLPGPWFF